ncbi:hypothetical protein [Sphingobium abikonense]|uniref:hypothetical protein n=1 Tax=Sphingobium abikonense TaxID=86193 RepID=UPI0012EDBCC3|nr:hypothetical protein [Sphingobium abikonense]
MVDHKYSNLFSCLYDQKGSIETNGGNPPYSVFRSTQSRNKAGDTTCEMTIHDFAVIWDEDHDERVICAIERLHLLGLLWPVVIAFESRGLLTLVLQGDLPVPENYRSLAHNACNNGLNDVWQTKLATYNRPHPFHFQPNQNTLPDFDPDAASFVFAIDRQWKLGLREKPLVELKSVWQAWSSTHS